MMNFIKTSIPTSALLLFPFISFAQLTNGTSGVLGTYGTSIIAFINSTLVPFVFAVVLLLFIYGVYLYFFQGKADEDNLKHGKSYMIWAVVALVVMVSVWGIVNLIANGLGLKQDTLDNIPRGIETRGSGSGTGYGPSGTHPTL